MYQVHKKRRKELEVNVGRLIAVYFFHVTP